MEKAFSFAGSAGLLAAAAASMSSATDAAAAASASSHGAPVLLLDESKGEAYGAARGLKKLVRRLRAHYDVQVCAAAVAHARACA